MSTGTVPTRKIEDALRGMARLIKAINYYPPAHPALSGAIQDLMGELRQLLQEGEPLTLAVRKDGFQSRDSTFTDPMVQQKLAYYLFSRRIHQLLILADLSARDLKAFARCLTLTPSELERMGGIQQVLRTAMVSTLWVNELDPSRILPLKEDLDARKMAMAAEEAEDESVEELLAGGPEAAAPNSPREERDLATVLDELEKARSDEDFQQLLQELVLLLRRSLSLPERPQVLRALLFLGRQSVDAKKDETRREGARAALRQLSTDDVIAFLLAFLCDAGATAEQRQNLMRILAVLGGPIVRLTMEQLAVEKDPPARRLLAGVLIRKGDSAVPALLEHLTDEREAAVGSAVAILGEIRVPSAVPALVPLLNHKNPRIGRETIRALTKIGGKGAVDAMRRIVEAEDQEMAGQAFLALGAMRNPAAVPALLRLLQHPDPWGRRNELKKGAVKALGEIGDPSAVPALLAVLKRRKLWQRRPYNELRTASAAALGEIGDAAARPGLEAATHDRSAALARTAAQALRQLKQG